MDFKDLVTLYFERTNALQTYWNFYMTIILALLAFFGSMKAINPKKLIAAILSFSFVAFAAVNLSAIIDVTKARHAVQSVIAAKQFQDHPRQEVYDCISRTIHPPPLFAVVGVHLGG
jgi:hypothetical protein